MIIMTIILLVCGYDYHHDPDYHYEGDFFYICYAYIDKWQ